VKPKNANENSENQQSEDILRFYEEILNNIRQQISDPLGSLSSKAIMQRALNHTLQKYPDADKIKISDQGVDISGLNIKYCLSNPEGLKNLLKSLLDSTLDIIAILTGNTLLTNCKSKIDTLSIFGLTKTQAEEQLDLTKSLVLNGLNLYSLQEKLKTLNQTKDEFLAICSHDLKSPISMLSTSTEILLNETVGQINPDQREILLLMKRQTEFAINLISDLLDLSKIENNIKLHYSSFDFQKLLSECIYQITPLLKQKGISLIINSDFPSINIFADNYRMQQVLTNVLLNAIKYSSPDDGQIKIATSTFTGYRQTDGLGDFLLFSIKNNGASIPSDKQSSIFNKYEQVKLKDQRTGSGLGLAICKHICNSHKGNIWFESNENGTTFFVALPYVIKDKKTTEPKKWLITQKRNKRALIIDHDHESRQEIKNLLSKLKMSTYEASNDHEALNVIQKYQPDIILLNVELELTHSRGLDTLHLLQEEKLTQKIPLLAIVNQQILANTDSIRRKVFDIIYRPLDKNELIFKMYDKLLLKSRMAKYKKPKKPHILIAENSPEYKKLLKKALQKQYNLVLSNNSYEAMFYIRRLPIALALIDIDSPHQEGIELVDMISKMDDPIPFSLMTEKNELTPKQAANWGADRILEKYIISSELSEVISRLVPRNTQIT